ncbi:hypothetical protein TCAL_10595 [Tigriopus californicus]|uniref:Nucleoside diphosphate kinase n=1 Tax=Tigriopus californicus TaxID=6832 RepID=A0A553P342_TIGCA|nr:hypothetical protein TCAL_10595 [Tigriopus californicus]
MTSQQIHSLRVQCTFPVSQSTSSNPGKNGLNGERSFVMLKPDAVHRKMIGEIMNKLERRGFKLVATKYMKASRDLLQKHYADLSRKAFFKDLIDYMASGPVVPMVWEGLNVVQIVRTMLGETVPHKSAPGSLRGDLCVDVGRNIIHASDSVTSARKEIELWFHPAEVTSWKPCSIEWIYEDETLSEGHLGQQSAATSAKGKSGSLAAEIAKARQHIKNSLECVDNLTQLAGNQDLIQKIQKMENDNKNLQKVCDGLKSLVLKLDERVKQLESGGGAAKPAAAKPAAAAEEDDDVDLFGSDSDEEEDAEKVRIREERLKAYHEKKSKKPALIAKTSVLLDVKPWDDETDMDAMLKACKTIEKEGLVWGASKLVPVGYGIKKLQVMCVVEDDKVSIDELCEQIAEFEDFVQSVDVAAMSKI